MLLRTVVFLLLWLLLIAGPLSAQNKTLGVTSLPEGTRKRAAIFFANQDYKIDQYDLTKEYNDADDMKAA